MTKSNQVSLNIVSQLQSNEIFNEIQQNILGQVSAKNIIIGYLEPLCDSTIEVSQTYTVRIGNIRHEFTIMDDRTYGFKIYYSKSSGYINCFELVSIIKECELERVPRIIVDQFNITDTTVTGLVDEWDQSCRLAREEDSDVISSDIIKSDIETDTVIKLKQLGVNSIAELMLKDIPGLLWIIKGLLPEGLTILAGKPKTGKSWFALQLCHSVSTGKKLFGKFDVSEGGVLYLSLEDSPRRLKSRIELMGLNYLDISMNFYFDTIVKEYHNGGREWLEDILRCDGNIKLVVIDTMVRFITFNNKENDSYADTYRVLTDVQKLTRRYHISILLIHHMRKDVTSDNVFDSILGSTAIPGVMDTLMALIKKEDKHEFTLTGRDLEEQKYFLRFDKNTCQFQVLGDADTINISESKQAILDAFEGDEILSPKQVSELIRRNHNTVKGLMRILVDEGELDNPERGQYRLKKKDNFPTSELSG